MKQVSVILLVVISGLMGCHRKAGNDHFVRTGMYYIVGPGEGIRMKKIGSGSTEDYYLAKNPFASVDNVSHCKVHIGAEAWDRYLELHFDEKGKKDLTLGTSNPAHPRIAIVIANRLLYVVDQYSRIETGIMVVGMDGYSEKEIGMMVEAIDNKQ